MRSFIKKGIPYFLILFLLLLSYDFFLAIFIPNSNNFEISYYNAANIKNDNYIYGRALYQDPFKYKEYVTVSINNEDIKKGDYVINKYGFLGTVEKIKKNRVVVKLVTNKDIYMQVLVNDCYGIMKYDKVITLANISNYCNVNEGDIIYISNLAGIKEKIQIGVVDKIITKDSEIEKKYSIKIYNDGYFYNDVLIIRKEEL